MLWHKLKRPIKFNIISYFIITIIAHVCQKNSGYMEKKIVRFINYYSMIPWLLRFALMALKHNCGGRERKSLTISVFFYYRVYDSYYKKYPNNNII